MIKKFHQFENYTMSKSELESELTKAWEPLFKAYPQVKKLPIYAWGRYYKYECAGEPFEYDLGINGGPFYDLTMFKSLTNNNTIQWDLLKEISKKHQYEIGNCIWGDYMVDRDTMSRLYHFDNRGGRLVIIENDNGILKVTTERCDSPE